MTGTIESTMKINVLPSARESREQHYENLNRAAREKTGSILDADFSGQHGDMWEINESIYHEFMNLLPPLAWRDSSFCISEMLTDDITAVFFQQSGSFFCRYLRMREHSENLSAFRIKAAEYV
ncbi:DUF1419 domain-containing protein [Nisaea sp.]